MDKKKSESPTIVCRCEDVTLDQLRTVLDEGVLSLEEIKRRTRCTMGPCQGHTCRHLITQEVGRRLGVGLGEIEQPTFRTPAKPVKLGTLADAESDPTGA